MGSDISKEQKGIEGLKDCLIYIVSPKRFQNELIESFLTRETGAECRILDSLSILAKQGEEVSGKYILALTEYPGLDGDLFWERIEECDSAFKNNLYFAIFNVQHGSGVEETAVSRGVKGIFYGQDSINNLPRGIEAIFKGELWVSREILTKYVTGNMRVGKIEIKKEKPALTQREIEILAMISAGATNEDIAEKLFISTNTVKTHMYNIFKKIDVPNRLQAALWAVKNL